MDLCLVPQELYCCCCWCPASCVRPLSRDHAPEHHFSAVDAPAGITLPDTSTCSPTSSLILLQGTCGAVYGIVPFISRRSLGLICGCVGAGGNLGGAITQVQYYSITPT